MCLKLMHQKKMVPNAPGQEFITGGGELPGAGTGNLGSSARAVRTLNCWSISLALFFSFLVAVTFNKC